MNLETDLQAMFSPAAHANPFPLYEAVRRHGSVLPMPQWNTNFVLSLEAVQKVFRLPSVSADRMGGMAHLEDTASMNLLRNMMLFHDGANHARLRGLVSSAFSTVTAGSCALAVRPNPAHRVAVASSRVVIRLTAMVEVLRDAAALVS